MHSYEIFSTLDIWFSPIRLSNKIMSWAAWIFTGVVYLISLHFQWIIYLSWAWNSIFHCRIQGPLLAVKSFKYQCLMTDRYSSFSIFTISVDIFALIVSWATLGGIFDVKLYTSITNKLFSVAVVKQDFQYSWSRSRLTRY